MLTSVILQRSSAHYGVGRLTSPVPCPQRKNLQTWRDSKPRPFLLWVFALPLSCRSMQGRQTQLPRGRASREFNSLTTTTNYDKLLICWNPPTTTFTRKFLRVMTKKMFSHHIRETNIILVDVL